MTWNADAARALVGTFDGVFGAPGVVTAAACVDESGTAIEFIPGDTPAGGRFEIGSISKTMTAVLLALLEGEGRLRLDDEVGRWLSAGANGGITLWQLATHTSGLPRVASNFHQRAVDPADPWAGYGFAQAEEGLRQTDRAPGRPRLYSNLGYHLLGLVLERASGVSFQELVTERLLKPLAMTCSGVGASGAGTPLPGHADGGEVPHWEQPLGPGGIEATIGDLARYALACLHPPQGPLGAAITASQQPRLPLGTGRYQALAWVIRDGIRAHDGGTGGFSSAILIDPGQGRAAAMLASHHGYGQELARATLLALTDGDPREARPGPAGPEWDDRAREIVQLLLDGRVADVHALATANFKEHISAEQIDRAVRKTTQDLGAVTEVLVGSRASAGHVIADARVTYANGTVVVRIAFDSSAQIAGLRITHPAKPPPPPT